MVEFLIGKYDRPYLNGKSSITEPVHDVERKIWRLIGQKQNTTGF